MNHLILAMASHPACDWACQYKKGWDQVPNNTSAIAPNTAGDVKLIGIVIAVVAILWILSKMRRIAA